MRKLLVIDDSPPIHALVRARLLEEDISILSANDGASGLLMASSHSPDLILLDVDMPGMNGFDVCRALKSDSATMQVPVIFLSGDTSTHDKIRGLELGALDYITKPFDAAELRARVRSGLRLKNLMDLLSRKAHIDGLTGLWNRRHFDEVFAAQQSLAKRHDLMLSCIMFDVDHFKSINDRFGHPFGDEVLKMVGSVAGEICRAEDIACRYGGEEFALIAPGTNLAGAVELAERIRMAIAGHPLPHRSGAVTVSASFGVAEFDPSIKATFVESADRALYEAKREGRNRVVAFSAVIAA